MGRIEKTVFISYRRTNAPWAVAISQNLTHQGYDVFFDFTGLSSGDFESVILENIRARAHFVVLLTPSALERCSEPGDWLRREVETALDVKRNIVALMLEGFSFGTPSIASQLTGTLAPLKSYNALPVPVEYFDEAMERLRTKFLNVPLDTVLHPASVSAVRAAKVEQAAAGAAPTVTEKDLTAQEWFERGFNASDPNGQVRFYSEAIRLKPDYADAFVKRGNAYFTAGDIEGALKDYGEAIRLKPDCAAAFYNRGVALYDRGEVEGSLQAYGEAIRLKLDLVNRLTARGMVRAESIDLEREVPHLSQIIRLKPAYALAFHWRALLREARGDLEGAAQDYSEAIRLKTNNASAFCNRAQIWEEMDKPADAVADYQKYLDLGGGARNGDSEEVERTIGKLKKKL